jgi:hypothetical protein
MAPPLKYQTEEEIIIAHRLHANKYAKKQWKCNICNCVIRIGNKTNHERSIKHIRNLS